MTAFSLAEMSQELFATRDRLAQITCDRAAEVTRFIDRLGRRIALPPRVALVGEFNSGKSTLANALLGAEVLPTSFLANTRVPLLLHYSSVPSLSYEDADHKLKPLDLSTIEDLRRRDARMLHVGLPVERLKRFELIDTPGLANGSSQVDALVLEACRRSHIAIWCTVASQAWKGSEQSQWARLPKRLQSRGVLAVTHIDDIASEQDRSRLGQRLAVEAKPHFGAICMLAAQDARSARQTLPTRSADACAVDTGRWKESGGAAFEAALMTALAQELAHREKSARRLLERTTSRLTDRRGRLPVPATSAHHSGTEAAKQPVLAA